MKEENRYQEALETAKEIDIVENVMIRTVTTQVAFSSMMGELEKGYYFRKTAGNGKDLREQMEQWGLKDKTYGMRYKDAQGNEKEVEITYDALSDRIKRRIDFAPLTLIEINDSSKKWRTIYSGKPDADVNKESNQAF